MNRIRDWWWRHTHRAQLRRDAITRHPAGKRIGR